MKIRSITCFFSPGYPPSGSAFEAARRFIEKARPAYQAAGYEVQTARLASAPFGPLLAGSGAPAGEFAARLEVAAQQAGFSYLSLGPALPGRPLDYEHIPAMLAATRDVFFGGLMTTPGGGVSLPVVRACARIIRQASTLSPDGFGNLRFAALANVPAGAPFFPAAYQDGEQPAFALATEAAGLAVEAFTQAGSLAEARRLLTAELEAHARKLEAVGQALEQELGARFGGIDFSPAPYPDVALSLGTALERLGVPRLGQHGSLTAAAILADTLDKARFPRVGFSGLMLPVLEDATLARRAAEGSLTVKDLLLFSAVCGTGLDTVPLPGDITEDTLAAILLDLAALALRLDKPLTARLMPIPGKQAGDPTAFDFGFFANSRVMAVEPGGASGLLAGDEEFFLSTRLSRS